MPSCTELTAFPVSTRECSGKATVKTLNHDHTVAAEGQNPAVEAGFDCGMRFPPLLHFSPFVTGRSVQSLSEACAPQNP
jgi:hypothetical protein